MRPHIRHYSRGSRHDQSCCQHTRSAPPIPFACSARSGLPAFLPARGRPGRRLDSAVGHGLAWAFHHPERLQPGRLAYPRDAVRLHLGCPGGIPLDRDPQLDRAPDGHRLAAGRTGRPLAGGPRGHAVRCRLALAGGCRGGCHLPAARGRIHAAAPGGDPKPAQHRLSVRSDRAGAGEPRPAPGRGRHRPAWDGSHARGAGSPAGAPGGHGRAGDPVLHQEPLAFGRSRP